MTGATVKLAGQQYLLYVAGQHGGKAQGLRDAAAAIEDLGASIVTGAKNKRAAQLGRTLREVAAVLNGTADVELTKATRALAGALPPDTGVASGA